MRRHRRLFFRSPAPFARFGFAADAPAETVCLEVADSFSPAAGVKTTPGLPLELTVDVVDGPGTARDVLGMSHT